MAERTPLDDFKDYLERLNCEPCESCGTSLMKRTTARYSGRWQIETWADPNLGPALEHTYERCREVRNV